MKYIGLLIIITLTLTMNSCGGRHDGEQKPTLLSNLLSITDNEDKGVKEILNFYGGECKYSIGASASSEIGEKHYFELELSKSDAIEEITEIAQMPASNIAYLFYRNLNEEERKKYDEIHVVLIFSSGKKMKFNYSSQQLKLVNQRMKVVDKIVGLIKEKNFEALRPMLNDTTFISYDRNELISNLIKFDPQFGNVTEGFRPFGFGIEKSKNGKEVLHISGAIIRDKQNNAFSVDLDLNGKGDYIYILQYKI
ncbi:MAG: hypothetical protein R2852_06935 [Bacteroidia bacterium]